MEMTNSDQEVSEAVDWWIQKEAANSTFLESSTYTHESSKTNGSHRILNELDDLELARKRIIKGFDPKKYGHSTRLNLWLKEYNNPDLSEIDRGEFLARILFGEFMFLSGANRIENYLVSNDQQDYFARKISRPLPYSASILDLLPNYLDSFRRRVQNGNKINSQEIQSMGSLAILQHNQSLDFIFERAPQDLKKAKSLSIESIATAENTWIRTIGATLIHGWQERGMSPIRVPIFEPKTIGSAKLTTLIEVAATRDRSVLAESIGSA
ncbi:MAG TPA: hypothetical protein VLF63_01330 [Patescibacteria group bacterium]|nr:hypothetical protein [Patescibacteria group bacterium]